MDRANRCPPGRTGTFRGVWRFRRRSRVSPWLLLLATFVCGWAHAEVAGDAIFIGGDECRACHKGQERSYLAGRHGKIFTLNPRDARESHGCEACHGPGSRHIQVVGELDSQGPLHIRSFKDSAVAIESSQACLGCHEQAERLHWRGSTHEMSGVTCTSCHKIHGESPVPTMEICLDCHKSQRAKLQRTAHMPLREGKVTCMNCHNPHGGPGPALLRTGSVNETCYQCHAEKRGPNIFEHPPVRENCANCHDPHGSNNPRLLKKRLPYLCQECHSVRQHVGTLYNGEDLDNPNVRQLRGKACTNCHSRIHGSNHPAGARFQR
ncbi:MAG: DmsE family decaheme c-type cytochrome [Gammaproteobacteria bacterium]|nr:DmsE family decaheme c-type cytochrome [Gammaproteobacteria bacterium]